MTTDEERRLLERILGYLEPSDVCNAVYIPPVQAMRNAADRLEQKERDIAAFKDFLSSHYN